MSFLLIPSSTNSVPIITHFLDLIKYCEREGMPFTIFEDWSTILATTKDIHSGKTSPKKVAEEGLEKR